MQSGCPCDMIRGQAGSRALLLPLNAQNCTVTALLPQESVVWASLSVPLDFLVFSPQAHHRGRDISSLATGFPTALHTFPILSKNASSFLKLEDFFLFKRRLDFFLLNT